MWNQDKTIHFDGAHIWVTPKALQAFGISPEYVRKATSHQRKHDTPSWQHLQNPMKGVRLLIRYSTIPETTKVSKGLPSPTALLHMIEKEAQAGQTHEALMAAIDTALEYHWDKYLIHYPDTDMGTKKALSQACAVLAVGTEWKKGDYGFNKKAAFYQAYAQQLDRIKLKYIRTSHPDRVGRLINKAKKEGIQNVVSRPNAGNKHRLKLSAWHQWVLLAYYAHPKKHTAPMIHSLLKYQASIHDKEEVSLSTVAHYLAKRDIQVMAAPTRDGEKAFKDFYRPYISRKPVMFPSDLWVMDGTRANFAYKKDNGQVGFLDVYMVMDAHSWCVLGFAISESEDRWVILDAIKMAVSLTGHLPCEMLFDNHSAKTTTEMQDMLAAIQHLGTSVRYANVGNAKDKHIERGFEAWQSVAARWYDNFVGEGIKSRRRNARPAPEWIAAQKKNLPDRTGVMRNIVDSIALYNEVVTEGGRKQAGSPRDRFKNQEAPNIYRIGPEQIADIFWESTVTKMRNASLTIQVRKVQYTYAIEDYEVWKHYDCNTSDRQIKVRIRYDKNDMGSVYVFDADTNEFLCEAKQKVLVSGDLASMTEQDRKQIMGQEARAKSWEERLKKDMDGIRKAAEKEMAPDAELVLISDPAKSHKGELNSAENAMMRSFFNDREGISSQPVQPIKQPEPYQLPTPKNNRKQKGTFGKKATLEALDD